ncbi:MAG: hypothetical protein DPW11_01435 [bacterium]|nr:hypothetical protein [Candidatus Microgenomates bacterium CPR3]MCQ3944423.1 hypothetical protein [bacterium]RIK51685.1 MAG: hypothetical protein DCC61_01940 [Candidatus Microgenomates bacterium]
MKSSTKIDPVLMEVADQVFWEEYNQRDNPGERYVVLDTKRQEIVVQNVKLIREMRKVKAD